MRRLLVPLIAVAFLIPTAALAHDGPPAAPTALRAASQPGEPPIVASPRATCARGDRPETGIQGRVPAGTVDGFTCNLSVVGREGTNGGFKVERYVDKAGHECAFYDSTLLVGTSALSATLAGLPTGVAVLDMSNPAKPVRTATLVTAAMQSPHESLLLEPKRGLLAAVLGSPAFAPGVVDIYDVSEDCRNPELMSSSPLGLVGHESGWTKDGLTFYATSISTGTVTALDVSDPRLPVVVWSGNYPSHGLTLNDAGTRAYVAGRRGLEILDTSEVQARKPNPQVPRIARLAWSNLTIPQNAIPVTIGGKPMLVEVDEYSAAQPGGGVASNGPVVGAGRIIDISDERAPRVISNFRLDVHQPENRAAIAADPGAAFQAQGYAGHYCGVPSSVDPGIVVCSFIVSGLRAFDIRDPTAPKEIAYFVAPPAPLGGPSSTLEKSNYAMSRPSFVPERGEVWYSDGNSGFYALRFAKGVWPFAPESSLGLPTTRRCVSQRSFTIRLRAPRGQRLTRATVKVGGRKAIVLTGRRLRTGTVNLRGLKAQTVKVTVKGRTAAGRTLRETRTYRTCKPRR